MKLAAIFAALFLAVSQISADAPGFALDREYKYEYKGRAATGITSVQQFTGIGIKGTIVIQNQGNYIYLKFENPEYGQFNQKFDHIDIYDELPITYQPIGGPHQYVKEALTKPIRVMVEKGLVKSFDVYPEDPEWSVNVKRSILSMLQLNLDGVNRIRAPKTNIMREDEHHDFYRVMEDGIGGDCETVYTITHHPYHHHVNERVVNVTKSRHYDHCTHRPYSVFTTHMGYRCEGCEGVNMDPLTTTSITEYQLRGDRHFYTIERIYNTGKFHFTPFTTNAQTIFTAINQTMFLENSWPIKTPITFPEKSLTYTSLAYNGTDETHYEPTKINLDVPNPPGFHFREPKKMDYKPTMGKLIEELAATYELTDDLPKKKLPEKFVQLVKLFTWMDFDSIKEAYETFVSFDYLTSTVEKQREKKTFFDALVATGTNPAIKFLFYSVENKYIRNYAASKLFDTVAYYVKDPSETLTEYWHDHMTKVDKTTGKKLYEVLWLGFGTLIHRGCDKITGFHDSGFHHSHHHVPNIRHETCTRYAQEVYDKLKEATEPNDEILYIKVLANMALKESLRYLKPIISGDAHYTEIVRLQSFWAGYKYLSDMKEEVLSVIVPVFYNYTEPHAIRQAAFDVITYSEPQYFGLKRIADDLLHEPDRQVANYIYSFFVAMANSSNPCYIRLKRDARRILATIPPVFHGYQYSREVLFDYYNDKYAFGGETVLSYSGSNESLIGESLYLGHTGQILGYNFDYFSVDLETRGFAKFYEKLFGGHGLLDPYDENKSVLNIFRRHPRDVNTIKKELNEIESAVPIIDRDHEPVEALLSFYSMGQDYMYYYFHEKNIPSLKDEGYLYLPKELPQMLKDGYKLNHHTYTMIADITYEVPTELGFPVQFNVKAPALSRMSGEVKMEFEPGFFPENRNFKKTSRVKLSTDLKPMMHVEAYTSVALKTPIMTDYGYGINHEIVVKFPLKVNVEYDVAEKKLHANYVPSKTTYKMLHYSNKPFTYINPKFNKIPLYEEPNVLPINYTDHPNTFEGVWGTEHFGAGLKIYGRNERTWSNFGSYYKWITSIFSKKTRNFESNPYTHNLVHRVIEGLMSLRDYCRFYPSMKPVVLKVYYTPSTQNPTTDYDLTIDFVEFKKTSAGVYTTDIKSQKIIQMDPSFRRVYGMHVDLKANGPVPRTYHVDYNISYPSISSIPRKFSLDYRRSPIPNYDPEEFKICVRSSLTVPPFNRFVEMDPKVEKKAEIDYTLQFGKECDSGKKIDAKVVLEKTDEQTFHIEHPEKCDSYLACQAEKKKGHYFSVPCFEYYTEYYNTLRKFTVDVHVSKEANSAIANSESHVTDILVKAVQHLKRYFWTNLWDYKMEPNTEGHIVLIGNVSLDAPARMDLIVKRPGLTSHYKDLYYPYYLPFDHFNMRRAPWKRFLDTVTQWNWEPKCLMTKNQIWTFDHFTYQVPETNCYHIFSEDCSKTNLYTLLTKKTDSTDYPRAIKLFVDNHKIEILPIGGVLTLRVDDVKQTLPDDNLLVLPHPEIPQRPLIEIYHVYQGYLVKAPYSGIQLAFNGKTVEFKIDNTFRGHVCGLCGDANGEAENEFVGPNKCVYDEEHPFTYSYAVPDGTCTIPTYDSKDCYYPFEPLFKGKCSLVFRNKVLYDVTLPGSRKQTSNVCFSNKPVPDCLPGCKTTSYVKNRVSFHCLNKNEQHTSNLIRESKYRELTELTSKSEDYHDVVQFPEDCKKA
ncbi:hypothetical protein CHUAL_012587 [Chamberlinius hualienensis]